MATLSTTAGGIPLLKRRLPNMRNPEMGASGCSSGISSQRYGVLADRIPRRQWSPCLRSFMPPTAAM